MFFHTLEKFSNFQRYSFENFQILKKCIILEIVEKKTYTWFWKFKFFKFWKKWFRYFYTLEKFSNFQRYSFENFEKMHDFGSYQKKNTWFWKFLNFKKIDLDIFTLWKNFQISKNIIFENFQILKKCMILKLSKKKYLVLEI